jgi:hypothetical protein
MMIVSHSVFKEQKKHQRGYLFQQASLLERRVTYANCLSRSTAFLFYFFRTISHSIRYSLCSSFCFEQGGPSYAPQFVWQPVFKIIFSEQFLIQSATRFVARFVSNKAGHSTRIKKPCNFFCKINSLGGKNNKKHQ